MSGGSSQTFLSNFDKNIGLYTDMYQLSMAQAYFHDDRQNTKACFDYFFRKLPFKGGYVIFAGLQDVLSLLEGFKFSDESRYF